MLPVRIHFYEVTLFIFSPSLSKFFFLLHFRNVGMADQGAYTCEAMNSEGSVLATPDAIINVIESGNNHLSIY